MILEPYRVKPNVWQELPGGEFSVSVSITGGNVEFGMFEMETDWWKGGMVLAGIKVNPKTSTKPSKSSLAVVTSNATTAFTTGAAPNGLTCIHHIIFILQCRTHEECIITSQNATEAADAFVFTNYAAMK
ncbi:hypothetical protein RJ640_019496 [Escallonia rubra]|uniref:Uncharacterized protein n=1 Tax=Escallonia rubra TaxID=112253 RepID=A0AA88RTK4_9ASTE|nr:hypothetical protein RJ640_019496 [Escallonia rubra]